MTRLTLAEALHSCICLLETMAESAQERDDHVEWAMMSTMASNCRSTLEAAASRPSPGTADIPEGEALRDIAAERQRQISVEGWTPEHDDGHDKGEMAVAAATYAIAAAAEPTDRAVMDQFGVSDSTPFNIMKTWPWSSEWWKPKSRRRDLVKAGALIVAEIERLDRHASPSPNDGERKP